MATDELVVSIRYQADLESFKKSISIAELQTNESVARMAQVLGSLHQPFIALFERLSKLQETANSFTLPDSQIEKLDSLTQKLSDKTGTLSANLKEIKSSLNELGPQIQNTIKPLADRQLEKNLEALTKLMSGGADEGRSGPSITDRVGTGAALVSVGAALAASGVGAPLTLGSAAVLFALGYSLEDIVGLAEDLAGEVQGLVSTEQEAVAPAEDLLGRFSNIAELTAQWAGSQERISKALEPAVEAYKSIEASVQSIKANASDLPTFGFGGGGQQHPLLRGRRGAASGGAGESSPVGITVPIVDEISTAPGGGTFAPRALGGSVLPGLAFLVGERGPEIFVPDQAGRILPNGILAGSGGGLLGDDFDSVIAEIERFGQALDQALEGVPEEVQKIAGSVGGSFIQSLEQGRGVMEAMQEAGRNAAGQMLHYLLQSEQVRGELGELADVIENVLNQALNGSIDSWEDLGRVALEVLQAIIEKMVEAQQAATQGGGNGGGIFGTIASLFGGFLGLGGGGNALAFSSTPGFSSGGGGTIFTNAGAGVGSIGGTPSFNFAGGFAGGGPLSAGQMALVGEMGPELFVPKVPGHVLANSALNGLAGSMGAGRSMTVHQTFNFYGRFTASERAETVAVARAAAKGAVDELEDDVNRGGTRARTFGRRR